MNNKKPIVKAKITFLSKEEGGRTMPPSIGYRPHIVIQDPNIRKPNVKEGNIIDEEYLGVSFKSCPHLVKWNKEYLYKLELIYYPKIEYGSLKPSATFTVREGGNIMGLEQLLIK